MAVVYILQSLKDKRTYTGSTLDINVRYNEHINGKVISTRHRRPLKIVYKEEYDLIEDARKREKYFKTTTGRRELRRIFNNIIDAG